jgi:hypothetical protein
MRLFKSFDVVLSNYSVPRQHLHQGEIQTSYERDADECSTTHSWGGGGTVMEEKDAFDTSEKNPMQHGHDCN